MELRKPKGLGNQQLRELLEELQGMAQRLRGEVMVLELAQRVQTFLHAYNQPPAKSFYEQMLTNKRKQEEKQKQEQQRKIEQLKKKEEKQVCEKMRSSPLSSPLFIIFVRPKSQSTFEMRVSVFVTIDPHPTTPWQSFV